MKILIVSKIPTHPVTAGNRSFILNNVNLLKKMGHELHFLYIEQISFHGKKDVNRDIEELTNYWGEKLHIYQQTFIQKIWVVILQRFRWIMNNGYFKCDDEYPFGLHRCINKLQKTYGFDACIVNYYYLSKTLSKIDIPLKGLYTHDYFAYKALLVGDKNVGYNTTASQEAKAMQRAPHIFALNTGEAEYFRRLSPCSKVYNVFNTYSYHHQPLARNHNIVFLSGNNPYNINGLRWFLTAIFPAICESFNDVKLIIGGSICNQLQGIQETAHIQKVGIIDNLDAFYTLGDVAINPTYQGTGLKIKTFEAISFDKVTMVHPHSIDGIFRPENAPIFSSINREEWVKYLAKVWGDDNNVISIKERNAKYIETLNEFIVSEYERFFSQKE